jgi:hypothetical protein
MSMDSFILAVSRGDSAEAMQIINANIDNTEFNSSIEKDIVLTNGQNLMEYVYSKENMYDVINYMLFRWYNIVNEAEKADYYIKYKDYIETYQRREESRLIEKKKKEKEELEKIEMQKQMEQEIERQKQMQMQKQMNAYYMEMQKQAAKVNEKKLCSLCYGRGYISQNGRFDGRQCCYRCGGSGKMRH